MQTQILLVLISSLCQGAVVLRQKREADPLFGNVVRGLIGLLSGGNNANQQSTSQTSPAQSHRPSYHAPAPSYHAPAPSYHAPAPSYHAPAPSYHAPAPSYHAPAPSYHAHTPPAPAPSHHAHAPAPSHHVPAPQVHHYEPPAPKPEIVILPAPDLSHHSPDTYGSPAPAYVAPAPAYEAPETYGSPAAPPAYEAPETYGSPSAPPAYEAPETYGAPVALPTYEAAAPAYEAPETYGAPAELPTYEAPVAAPVYEAPVYEEPVALPVYEAPVYEAPVAAPVYEAPLPSYDSYEAPAPAPAYEEPQTEAPVYVPDSPPVYQPNTYDPAPVDLTPLARIVPTPDVAPVDVVTVQDVVDVKQADIVDVVVLRADEEPRQPKSFSGESSELNQIQNSEIEIDSFDNGQESIVIDLTNSDQVVISSESFDAFPSEEEQPALPPAFEQPTTSVPQQILNFEEQSPDSEVPNAVEEVIIFEPIQQEDLTNHENTFVVIQQESQSTPIPEDFTTQEPITPIASSQELRNVISLETEQDLVQVFDFSNSDQEVAELVITEVTQPSNIEFGVDIVETQPLESQPQDIEIIEINEEVTDFGIEEQNVATNSVEEAPPVENTVQDDFIELLVDGNLPQTIPEIEEQTIESIITTTKAPILRKATFQLQEQEGDISFQAVEAEAGASDTFLPQPTQQSDTFVEEVGVTEVLIPEPLVNDPAFQEIAKEGVVLDQKKRASLAAYDPRQGRVYGHKYNDNNSNWYYYSRSGY